MYELIKKVAKDIYGFREEIEKKAHELREKSETIYFNDMVEEEIIHKVKALGDYSFKIAAVDSGVYTREMHSITLIFVRTLSTIFTYKDSKLVDSYNVPEFPVERLEDIVEEEVDAIRFKNLVRLEEEIRMAIKVLDEKPDILFVDGSILPLLSDRPKEDNDMFKDYEKLCSLYKHMISKAMKNSTLLAGIVKDARSRKLVRRLGIGKSIDTFFLDFFLEKGERTAAFRHTMDDNLLFKLIPQARDVLVFYIKSSEYDRPLRVEFVPSKYSFDEVASIIYTLTSISENYAYPSILFEVDRRVAIKKEEVKAIEKQLSLYSDLSFLPLRRNSRPFKR